MASGLDRDAGSDDTGETLRLAQTDWLYHQLDVAGPVDMVGDFRKAARGAGMIPWHLDLDRVEENAFLLLVAPPAPQTRTLSAAGARILAEELRAAVARRHEAAIARVGRSVACSFDLHAVLPVPGDILRLGPGHPQALRWLWTHWGTTQALRHVTVLPGPLDGARADLVLGEDRVSLRFWSADWTPWRALLALQARWPVLRWHMHPRYDAT